MRADDRALAAGEYVDMTDTFPLLVYVALWNLQETTGSSATENNMRSTALSCQRLLDFGERWRIRASEWVQGDCLPPDSTYQVPGTLCQGCVFPQLEPDHFREIVGLGPVSSSPHSMYW